MRIGICFDTRGNGPTRYFWNLLEALLLIDRKNEYCLYLDGISSRRYLRSSRRIHYRRLLVCDEASAFDRVQSELPRKLIEDRIDLLHTQFNRFPLRSPCKTIVAIHDIIPLAGQHSLFPAAWRRQASHHLQLSIRLADHIIVPSRYVKHQIARTLHPPPEKISQIYPGCPPCFSPIPREQAVRAVKRRFHLTRPFVLNVGLLSRRKNQGLLIKLFRKRIRKVYDLVLVGKLGWQGDHVLQSMEEDRNIHYLGPVRDSELHRLYVAAECLAFPSLDEGFGLPLLEAMACGTSVVASRCSSIPEVVGDAGILVEPNSVDAFASALDSMLNDRELRKKMRKRGLKRIRRFNWETAAAKVLRIYRRLAGL